MTTALETALACWNRSQGPSDFVYDIQADAVALGKTGMFSINHISLIVGLPRHWVSKWVSKTDKTGGRFNPEALPLIYDLWVEYGNGGRDVGLMKTIVNIGVSEKFLSKLTGIPHENIRRWLREYEMEK